MLINQLEEEKRKKLIELIDKKIELHKKAIEKLNNIKMWHSKQIHKLEDIKKGRLPIEYLKLRREVL